MRTFSIILGRAQHQRYWLGAFADGLRRHGISPEIVDGRERAPEVTADVVAFWGHRRTALIEAIKRTGRDYVVLERGYLGDRYAWTSVGLNGLNGRADFRNEGMPGDRWQKYFEGLSRPWRFRPDGYALLIGQVPGDASHAHADLDSWYCAATKALRANGRGVKFRPHPLAPPRDPLPPLEDDLAEAAACVTFNSNTGVEAVLAGVPTIACDPGSMAWPVAGHTPAEAPPMPDRTQWAHDLAYAQWTHDEIARGEAWEHINREGD